MTDRLGISLEEWYPIVKDLVDTPKTEIAYAGKDLTPILYAGEEGAPDVSEEMRKLGIDIAAAAQEVGGFPIFLRTGHMSGKHQWKDTCFVPDRESIAQHVYNIVEYSELADVFGGRPTDVWAVREFLRPRAAFTAFEGMPITRERRYFVVDGEVVGHHPYWPPEAFEILYDAEWHPSKPERTHNTSTDLWRDKLELLNADTDSDLIALGALSMKVGAVLPGAWSIDWLWVDERGWVLTDMAWAEESFVWWDHPDAPKKGAWK